VEVLSCIKEVAGQIGIPFFLVGAKARDLFFTSLFDIPTKRASLDIDLGIKVNSWDEVAKLVEGLTATPDFTSLNKIKSRFRHTNGTLIDIVPFGSVENSSGKVQWPTDDAIMTTLGFEEAFAYSLDVLLRNSPPLVLKICTPPAMVILKLIAWDEKYPERAKDGQDIDFIMQNYIEAGNDFRLSEEDHDLYQENGFDYTKASARILGRDITKIASDETISFIVKILERETKNDSDFRLILDMKQRGVSIEDSYEQSQALLLQLKLGITDKRRS
jgi:predicted nucleotidyltransferase